MELGTGAADSEPKWPGTGPLSGPGALRWLWQGDDVVGAERYGSVSGQRSACQVGVVNERDAREGDDVALPLRRRADCRRATDLPVHVLRLCAIDQDNITGGRERAAGLKDERRIRISTAV